MILQHLEDTSKWSLQSTQIRGTMGQKVPGLQAGTGQLAASSLPADPIHNQLRYHFRPDTTVTAVAPGEVIMRGRNQLLWNLDNDCLLLCYPAPMPRNRAAGPARPLSSRQSGESLAGLLPYPNFHPYIQTAHVMTSRCDVSCAPPSIGNPARASSSDWLVTTPGKEE